MNLTDIANIRLISQQITATKFKTPKALVGWMGAMQAQDYNMAKWAIGVRLPGSAADKKIEAAINKGEVIRTHLLRPTWHFVSANDIYWILELTAPQIKASMKSRNKELELTEKIFTKSNSIIEKALSGGKHFTREELMVLLQKAKIRTDEYRSGHLMLQAELDGIVCSGSINGLKQTYALLEERIPKPKSLSREEALVKLAQRYFSSHYPATLQDFIWWSGLSTTDSKHALETIKSKLISETIGSQTYWLPHSFSIPKTFKQSAYLLPAFDEFTISYKDRSASVSIKDQKRSISFNGIFKPTIVIDGQIIGIWKRTMKKDKVIVETEFFKKPQKSVKESIAEAAISFGHFLEKKIEIYHHG